MPTTLERIQYGFDRDSRRTWRRRLLTLNEDNAYGYDGLSQIVQDSRGNLNLNATAITVPMTEETWEYDPTGNWRRYKTQADGNMTLDQHRAHDKGNRLTGIKGTPSAIVLDRAGRMRQIAPDASGNWDESLELKWDAWGRITQVKRVSDEEVLGSYSYDGMTRRVTREVWDEAAEGMVVRHCYYSRSWRPLEEREAAATAPFAQYFWGSRHRDDLVRRDRDANSDGILDETRFVLMDYYSPAAIVDAVGAVTERFGFSAFGVRRLMAPNFSARTISECSWEFGFQGQFLDGVIGLLDYGYRYYSPYLGRWTRKDPIGERGGYNLYAQVSNQPTNGVDFLGLIKRKYVTVSCTVTYKVSGANCPATIAARATYGDVVPQGMNPAIYASELFKITAAIAEQSAASALFGLTLSECCDLGDLVGRPNCSYEESSIDAPTTEPQERPDKPPPLPPGPDPGPAPPPFPLPDPPPGWVPPFPDDRLV